MAKKSLAVSLSRVCLAYMSSRMRLNMKKELGSPTITKQSKKIRGQYETTMKQSNKTKCKFDRPQQGQALPQNITSTGSHSILSNIFFFL